MVDLTTTVRSFARATWSWPESALGRSDWAWDAYAGVRYLHLHAAMALRALAGRLHGERGAAQRPLSLAQHTLADHHAAFRDLEALLLGVPESCADRPPAPGEWPIRTIVRHVRDVEHYFYATILNALDGEETEVTAERALALTGLPLEPPPAAPLDDLWEEYAALHATIQARLAGLDDAQVQQYAVMWEATPYPILFRMQRFAAHLREHTNQLSVTRRLLGEEPGEAQLLLRQLYAALAEVEGLRIGQGALGEAACAALAQELHARFDSVGNFLTGAG